MSRTHGRRGLNRLRGVAVQVRGNVVRTRRNPNEKDRRIRQDVEQKTDGASVRRAQAAASFCAAVAARRAGKGGGHRVAGVGAAISTGFSILPAVA